MLTHAPVQIWRIKASCLMECSDHQIRYFLITNKSFLQHASLINSNLTRNPTHHRISPLQAAISEIASKDAILKVRSRKLSPIQEFNETIEKCSRNYSRYLTHLKRNEWELKRERKGIPQEGGLSLSTMSLLKVCLGNTLGLSLYGKNWKKVERLIPTWTSMQIWSHAQKFFIWITEKWKVKDVV